MNRRQFSLALLGGAAAAGLGALEPAGAQGKTKKIQCITWAQGFKHSSRALAADTVKKLGEKTGKWEVVGIAEDQAQMNAALAPDRLKDLDLVFFANTTGDLGMTPEVKTAFYNWIKDGGAYAGVHSASDTYHGDAEYLDLVRGEFLTHGPQVKVKVFNQDPKHPATKGLPEMFEIYDEIYQFKNWDRSRVHVLLSLKNHPDPKRAEETGDYAVAWTNRLGKGRMFYTSLGHREDVYQNEIYLQHLTGGLLWALGLAKGDDKPGNPIR